MFTSIKKRILYFGVYIEHLFLNMTKKITKKNMQEAKNIIVVGGELFNKGAQAMSFVTIDQIKKRFRGKNMYLFSSRDYARSEKEKANFQFKILPWDWETKMCLFSNCLSMLLKNNRNKKDRDELNNTIKNALFFVDVSGYALSSDWEWTVSADYLLNIIIANKFNIPYYIFPQSFGPFDYSFKNKLQLYPLINLCMKYPRQIFAREETSMKYLSKFRKNNIFRANDILLQVENTDLRNIYKDIPNFKKLEIEPDSVGIIPNSRVKERMNEDKFYLTYKMLIKEIICCGHKVYILNHSSEDSRLCARIKKIFSLNEKVELIDGDLNAIELEHIIKQFNFIVASRYHSIVQAYKNGIPALVIGWADKYYELLNKFDQSEYFIDVRTGLNEESVKDRSERLLKLHSLEKERIKNRLLINNNIFDCLLN